MGKLIKQVQCFRIPSNNIRFVILTYNNIEGLEPRLIDERIWINL